MSSTTLLKWGLLLLATVAAACHTKQLTPPEYQLPSPGQHPTLEQFCNCSASDVQIAITRWHHWTSKARPPKEIEAEVRKELRDYVLITASEQELLSHSVSLLGYSGEGSMQFPGNRLANWKQQSSFLRLEFTPPSGSGNPMTIYLAPRDWLDILKQTKP